MSTCELCTIRSVEMEFNAFMPTFGLMVRGNICMKCFGEAEHDMQIAAKLVGKRMNKRGIQTPLEMQELVKLLPSLIDPEKEEDNGGT